MNENQEMKAWEFMEDLIMSDEMVSTGDLRRELEEQGVDVTAGLEALHLMVRKSLQKKLKTKAQQARDTFQSRTRQMAEDIASWPIDKLRDWMRDAQSGELGEEVAGMAYAYHRNKQDRELTEIELRALVLDILSSKQ